MIGAFAYLILTTTRNRVRTRVLRLRNPRYAVAMLMGALYIWGVYFRPGHERPHAEELLGPTLVALAPLLTLAFVAWLWIAGGDRGALAFTPAEVALLFTAPVSRRTLVVYRIARTQLAILATSIVWAVIFRQAPSLAEGLAHVLSYWVMLATLNMNRLGVALIHAGVADHGLRATRRSWIAIAVVVALIATVVAPIGLAWGEVRAAAELSDAVAVIARTLTESPARWALYPFRVLVAPLSAPLGAAWLTAMAQALVLLALLTAWVLRTDTAFEETAAEASAAQARRLETLRSRRGAKPVPARRLSRTLPLAPTGPPAVALFWKNAMWLLRATEVRGMLAPPAIALACAAFIAPRSEIAAVLVATMTGFVAAGMLLFGPMMTRNDLRSELLHLGLLKTFPLRGRDIVLAEVASSAIPVAVMQYLLLVAVLIALSRSPMAQLTPAMLLAASVGAVLPVLGLNGAAFIIHNGIALLFPGWVRLGGRGNGVENLGFGMIALAFVAIALALLLVLPVGAGAGVLMLLRARPALAILLAALAAGAMLVAEVVACAWALGGSLDRVEPMAVEA